MRALLVLVLVAALVGATAGGYSLGRDNGKREGLVMGLLLIAGLCDSRATFSHPVTGVVHQCVEVKSL